MSANSVGCITNIIIKKDQKKHNKGDPERAACSKKEGDGYDQSYFLDSNETERPSPNNKPPFIRYE